MEGLSLPLTLAQLAPATKTSLSVSTSGTPSIYGTSVTFTATITSGATGSITFYDGSTSLGSSSIQGMTASLSTSALNAGSHSITAYYPGFSKYKSVTSNPITQTVNKATPTITWAAPAPIIYGTTLGSTQLDATASTPGTFVYSPASGTVLNAGTQTLSTTFTPTDTADYNSSTSSVSLTINKATPSLSVSTSLSPSVYGTQTTFTATISSGPAGSITFLDSGNAIGTGTISGTTATYATSNLTAGSHSITASWVGNSNYNPVASSPITQTVSKANPVITWATPAPISYGTALSTIQLNASASVPGTFAYTPSAGTILGAGSQSLSVTFTPTDSVDYATATKTITVVVNKAAPPITWPAPAAITYGTALSGTQLNASSMVPGSFAYSPAAGTVLSAGSQTLSVVFTPSDSADYSTATANVVITVNKAIPVIIWTAPAAIVYGTALSATQLNATSSVPGTFVYTPAAGTVLTAGSQTLSTTFTPTDTSDYVVATANVSLAVSKAAPSITWVSPTPVVYGTPLSATQLNATSPVPGAFTYSPGAGVVLTAGSQTLTTTFTPNDGTDYSSASASVTLTVNKATPVINWPTPAAISYGTPLSATQLSASSSTAGSFAYTPGSGTVLKAGSQTLSTAFTPTDAADYNSATASVTLIVNKATPVITWPTPTSIIYGTALNSTELDASTTTSGSFVYSPSTGAILNAGSQSLSTTFTPTDAADYNSATASVTLTVNKATPLVTWNSPAPITYGTALSVTQLDASSSVPGSFVYAPIAGTLLTAGAQTLSATLTPTDSANYKTAIASITLTVNQAVPTVSWATPSPIAYPTPLGLTQLNATASVPGTFSYTPPSGTVLPVGTQSLSVAFSPTDSTDYTTGSQSVSIIVKQESFTMPGPGLIATMAGNGIQGYSGDEAVALAAELNSPSDIAVDANGNAYIADAQNNVIREVLASNNQILTVAGNGTVGYSGDGSPAISAQLSAPNGVALDSAGNLYIADRNNNAIRKVNLANGTISTFVGNGASGYSGDGGAPVNAQLNSPAGIAIDASGNIFVADAGNNAVRKIDAAGTQISTFAGNGVAGNSGDNGPASSAELNYPTSVALDPSGDLYIADTLNERVRKVTAATGVISAYAGQGQLGYSGDGGPALSAELKNPTGLATDANGNLYITDVANSVIREVSRATGVISTIAGDGSSGYSGDGGTALKAQLGIDQVDAVAVDGSGNLYIADTDNNVVRVVGAVKVTPTLTVAATPNVVPYGAVSTIFTAKVLSGGGTVSFSNGAGWSSGPVLLSNGTATASLSNSGWAAGNYAITASYSGDALDNPVSASTTLAVTSGAKITPAVTWTAPSPISAGTPLGTAQLNATASVPGTFFYTPAAGTVLPSGTNALSVLFVPTDSADDNSVTANVILLVNESTWGLPPTGIIGTVAGNGTPGYSGDGGGATSAELTMFESGMAVDASGDIYIADWQNNIVRKVSGATGKISTIAGSGVQGYSGDNRIATSATLNGPTGVAVDAIGNLYIADAGNNVIRKVSPTTNTITTIAGNGTSGFGGDNGPASQAEFSFPFGIAVSTNGDLYIADMGNNVIRRIDGSTATITTVAGTGAPSFSGDNAPAVAATLNSPSGVAVDNSGNIYITDLGNNSVRAVFASGNIPGLNAPVPGNIYTLVGSGSTAAINVPLNDPEGVAVDQTGNIYIADSGNNQLRAVYAAGLLPNIGNPNPGSLYTLAGTGAAGYTGDGSAATSAQLSGPAGVATDGSGHIYIADRNNQVVRAIGTPAKTIPTITWPAPASITYGSPLGAMQFIASSSTPGTFSYEPAPGTILRAGTQALGVTFTPNDTSIYATVTGTSSIVVNQATPVITWSTPAPITPETALGSAQLNATASVPGTFAYTPAAGTVSPLGPLTITVTFTPLDTVDYTSATASVTMMIQQVTPTINWPAPVPITYGTALSSAQLFATASVPGTFTFNPPIGTVLPAGTATLTASFVPNDTISFASAMASVPMVVNQAMPSINWPTPSAITSGTPLSAVQLNATANVPGSFTYSPAAGEVLPVGTTMLTATFTPTDTGNYASATAQVQQAVNQALAPGAPILQLRNSPTPNAVTLSKSQDLDWIIWATTGSTPVATRMSGASLISDITPLSGATLNTDLNGQVAYSWTGGTPTSPTGSAVTAETYTTGSGAGFELTAPADTSVKTLLLYVNIGANAQLTASLSDGSSPVLVHTPTTVQDNGNEVYAIDYRAASSGQTLTVQLVSTDTSANVGLQAAILQPHLPDVAILSPIPSQPYPLTGVPVIVNASQFDNPVASVQLVVNGTNSTLLTAAPFETTLTLPAGHYSIAAQAIDTSGLPNTSNPVEFDVIKAGGSLSDSFSQLGDTVTDLTAEGIADWTTFAPAVYGQQEVERKAGVVPEISNFALVGSGVSAQYSAIENFNSYNRAIEFSYSDGAPDSAESGIFPETYLIGSVASNPGFQITVPADTSSRTLRLYAQNCGSDVRMTAFLSDGSAPPIVDNSLTDSIASQEAVYAIHYAAATPSQTLTVRLVLSGQNNGSWGLSSGQGVACLTAATLAGGQPSAPNVTAITPQSGMAGTTVTVTGDSFGTTQAGGEVTINGTPLNVLSWNQGSIQAVLSAGIQTGPVQVSTAVGQSNTDVVFTVAPTVTSLTPSVGPIGSTVTIAGINLGSSQGNGTVTFNGIPAVPVSWTDTQIVVTVPSGAMTGPVTVTQAAPASVTPLFVVTSGVQGSPSPLLRAQLDKSPMSVNLSDPANLDWVVWQPANSSGSTVRKAGANLISDITSLNSTSIQSDQNGVVYSWTGGSPTPTGVSQPAGVYGFTWTGSATYQLTAAADTTVRTLKLYCFECGYDHLNLSLSDGSSPAITYTPTATDDFGEQVFSIDYRAGSPGQTLTVQIVASPIPPSIYTRGIQLEAAVLEPHPPEVSILSPLDGQQLPAGTAIPLGIEAWQFDSPVNSTLVSANGTQLFSLQPPTSTATWTPAPGHYTLQAQAADAQGLASTSKSVSVDIIGSGGALSQTNTAIPQTVDLTSIGTADWIMFDYCGKLPYYGEVRKQGVSPMISDFKIIGDEFGEWYPWGDNGVNSTFSFGDGTPVGQDSTIPCGATFDNGVPGNGFELRVNADTTPRTLYVYVANWQARGKLKAFLSDGSAPVISDTSVVSQSITTNYGSAVYAVHFNAASAGQTLTVQWTDDSVLSDPGYNADAYTELYAVALDGPPAAPSSGPIVQSLTPESGAVGTSVTIKGSGFGASQGTSTVTFNGNAGTPTNWSDTQIQVPAPLADNTGYVELTVNGVASEPVLFNMPPTITSLSCSFCAAGSTITINGYNFGANQVRYSDVWIQSLLASAFQAGAQVLSWTDTQIQIVMPSVPSYYGTQMEVVVRKLEPFNNGDSSGTFGFTTSASPLPSIVQWQTPEPIRFGTPLSATQLNATASVPGTFVYSPAAGTILPAGPVVLTATFTPTDTANYTSATVQVNLEVNKSIPTVSWQQPASITYGTPLSSIQLNATSSVPGQFIYNPAAGAVPLKGTDKLYATFVPTDALDYQSVTTSVDLVVTAGKAGIEIPPPGMIGSFVGNGTRGSAGDGGLATDAEINNPYGMAVDSQGNVYVADTNNNVIREVNASTGVITAVAGTYTAGYSGDGGLAINARLNNPYGVAVDATGNLYIADTLNNAIRRVDASTGNITSVAGDKSGLAGYVGDSGLATAARLNFPTAVAVDSSGNLVIADWGNNAVRQVNASTGIITTAIGDGTGKAGYQGDGGSPASAQLNQPFGVAIDKNGNIYVSDSYNNRVREVTASTQIINTIAGNGTAGYLSDNGPAISAELNYPLGVALDASGNLFIADWMNNAIREVDTSGVITTVAGNGAAGYSGDGGLGTDASLSGPTAVATDALVAQGGTSQSLASIRPGSLAMKVRAMDAGSGGGAGGNLYFPDPGNNRGRLAGTPSRNTPPFPVPAGQYLAWAYPSAGTASGQASALSSSGSFFGPGSITWTGFAMPNIPKDATIQGYQAVVAYTATSMNGLTATMSADGSTFKSISSNGTGVAYSGALGGLPGSITVSLDGSGEGSFIVTSVAVAITYTIPVGGGGCTKVVPYKFESITLVDPYLLSGSAFISPMDVIAVGSSTAQGFVADGTSTAIAVLKIGKGQCPILPYDVTFTVDNGATLSPWDPAFLSTAPGPQSTSGSGISLTVPWEQFIYDGSDYYALALVTSGTPATSAVLLNTYVSVPNSGIDAQPLLTYPVPVVFVHGLWGNRSSLDSTRSYLQGTALGSAPSYFLTPICYSQYLAYYASADGLPGGECEKTSTQALADYFSKLYSSLDNDGIVGSRVDYVAHSMGGLVARNFSSSAATGYAYRNYRNRLQGAFRDVITLDSPEQGSMIAWYLDNVFADEHMDPNTNPVSESLYEFACVFGKTGPFPRSVRDCMANMFGGLVHLPLAYPGHPLSEGTVASLIPGEQHMLALPNPNIPNTTWYSVSANFHTGGTLPISPLEFFLNTFLAATYSISAQPITINSMLGESDNDIIVTVPSQTWNAVPGQSRQFPRMEHAPLIPVGLLRKVIAYGGIFTDANVTNSPEVNQQVASWLGYNSSSPSTNFSARSRSITEEASDNVEAGSGLLREGQKLFVASERLSLAKDQLETAELGQSFELQINVTRPDVSSIMVVQHKDDETLTNEQSGTSVGSGEAKVIHDDGLSKTIEIVPLQLGVVSVDVLVSFQDGGYSKQTVELKVRPSAHGLKYFHLNSGFRAMSITIGSSDADEQMRISPEVLYSQLDHPIHLKDAKEIAVRVDQSDSDPVVKVDPDGTVHGLRTGHVKITGEFDGVKDGVVVDVYDRATSRRGYSRSTHPKRSADQ